MRTTFFSSAARLLSALPERSAFFFFDFPALECAHADGCRAARTERQLLVTALVSTRPNKEPATLHVVALVSIRSGGEMLGADVTTNRLRVLEENRVTGSNETFG